MKFWAGVLAGWLALGVAGAALAAPVPIALQAGGAPVTLDGQPQALVPRGSVSIAEAAAGRLEPQLKPGDGGIIPFTQDNELWMAVPVRNAAGQPDSWEVQVTLPSIDEVTLFEMRGEAWVATRAGDRVATDAGRRPSRFARFRLSLNAGETRAVFMRVRNAWPAPVPARLIAQPDAQAAEQDAGLGFGVMLGALALLVAACLIQAVLYRDSAYSLYAAYTLLLGFAAASLTGLAGQHLWGDYPDWNDTSKAVFPLAGAGVSVWLVGALCRVRTRDRWIARACALLGGAVIGTALLQAGLLINIPWLTAGAMLVAAASVMAIALWAWRRGDPMGGWVIAAHAPLIGTTALILLRMFGVSIVGFNPVLLVAIAVSAVLPLLLVALYLRSRELLAVQARARELPSIDPLTGLLSARLFSDRLRAAVSRYRKSRHNAAVLYVRLANYPRIREVHGSTVAEQSVIRAAMKLQRFMPDADCIARVGENTLGVIIETVTTRAALTERSSRLVAHGLMPLPGLKPEVTLNLHIAVCVLADIALNASELQAAMENMLASMSARTRRPIRFVEPVNHAALVQEDDSDKASLAQAAPGSA